MSSLKTIVPEYEECLNIPSDAFTDTALVWVEDEDGIELVLPREVAQYEHDEMIPAPTLEEIIDGYCNLGARLCVNEFQIGNESYSYPVDVEDAMWLWFKITKTIGRD